MKKCILLFYRSVLQLINNTLLPLTFMAKMLTSGDSLNNPLGKNEQYNFHIVSFQKYNKVKSLLNNIQY